MQRAILQSAFLMLVISHMQTPEKLVRRLATPDGAGYKSVSLPKQPAKVEVSLEVLWASSVAALVRRPGCTNGGCTPSLKLKHWMHSTSAQDESLVQ